MQTRRTIAVIGVIIVAACARDPRDDEPEASPTAGGSATTSTTTGSPTTGGTDEVTTQAELTSEGDASSGSTSGPGFMSFCGNGILEPDEICDGEEFRDGLSCVAQGFESGVLLCNDDCLSYETDDCFVCGNGKLENAEDCEGLVPIDVTCEGLGFDGGSVGCGSDCEFDTSACTTCGDGVAAGEESCDVDDFDDETCGSLGFAGGNLGCTESCRFDFTTCDAPGGEFGSDSGYTGYALTPSDLPCDDISGTGVATNLGDESNVVVPVGFSFPFYGTDYGQANIHSNGMLRFGDAQMLTFSNTCLPTGSTPSDNTLFVMWKDLDPSAGSGNVYYQTLGAAPNRRFVVQWDTANFAGSVVDLMRLQAVLHENSGRVEVCYPDTINGGDSNNAGAESTAGIQHDTMTGFEFSCNMPSLVDGTLLLYVPN